MPYYAKVQRKNHLLSCFYLILIYKTNLDSAGQIGTLIATCQNIAYLVVTFGWE